MIAEDRCDTSLLGGGCDTAGRKRGRAFTATEPGPILPQGQGCEQRATALCTLFFAYAHWLGYMQGLSAIAVEQESQLAQADAVYRSVRHGRYGSAVGTA